MLILLCLQEIKKDNKETRSCKIVLYRTFLKCGIKTWGQVIKALEKSGHDDIVEQVKLKLLKNYSKVMNNIASYLQPLL